MRTKRGAKSAGSSARLRAAARRLCACAAAGLLLASAAAKAGSPNQIVAFTAPPRAVFADAPQFQALEGAVTRFSIQLSEAVPFNIVWLPGDGGSYDRLLLDLAQVEWRFAAVQLDPQAAIGVVGERHSQFRPGHSRLVLDLAGAPEIRRYTLRRGPDGAGVTLEVDFKVAGVAAPPPKPEPTPTSTPPIVRGAPSAVASAPESAPAPRPASQPEPEEILRAASLPTASIFAPKATDLPRLRPWLSRKRSSFAPPSRTERRGNGEGPHVVMLDAGHGGADAGAVYGGFIEKTFTLEFAKMLRDELNSPGEIEVVMSRDGDRMIKPGARVDLARDGDADLFVSLHANAYPQDRRIGGASVFTLDKRGAEKHTAALSGQTDAAETFTGAQMDGVDPELAEIILDLRRSQVAGDSQLLANLMLAELEAKQIRLERKNQHRHANFRVLRTFERPSVLVELGYATNPKDRREMSSKAWKRAAAAALARAIRSWLKGDAGALAAAPAQH